MSNFPEQVILQCSRIWVYPLTDRGKDITSDVVRPPGTIRDWRNERGLISRYSHPRYLTVVIVRTDNGEPRNMVLLCLYDDGTFESILTLLTQTLCQIFRGGSLLTILVPGHTLCYVG